MYNLSDSYIAQVLCKNVFRGTVTPDGVETEMNLE